EIDRRPPSQIFGSYVDLRDTYTVPLRIELAVREIRAEHEQHVAIEHGVVAGGEADQAGHADVVGILPLDMLLAAHRMHHRGLEPLTDGQQLIVRPGASGTA